MATPPPLPTSAPPAWRSKGKSSPFTKTGSAGSPSGPAPPPRKPRRTESMPRSTISRTFPLANKEKVPDCHRRSLTDTPPPPVPSTPRPAIDHSHITMWRYPHPDEKFTLFQLIEKHSQLFPIRVRVVKGFFGERGEDSAIAVDEVYNIHFVKKSKVVRIRDVVNNKYIVPINSATKFGLIYSNPQITDECHVFETVDDIINATHLPKVVCALASYQCSDEKASFNRNDVLIVKEVQKSSRFKRSKNTLKVLSLDTLEEKYLSKDAVGKFTVDPSRTKLYLLELLEYLENPVPCYTRMYIDFEANEPLPDYLTSERVRIEAQFVETSVISSPVFEDEEVDPLQPANDIIVDIPVSLDIEVSVIPPGDGDADDDYEGVLYTRTENLLNEFDPSQAKAHTDRVEQSQLFSAVRKGFEKEGLDIVVPERVGSVLKKSGTGNVQVANNHQYQPMDAEGYIADDYEDVEFEVKATDITLDNDHPPPLPPPLTVENSPPPPPERKNPRKGMLPRLPQPPAPYLPPVTGLSPKSPPSLPSRPETSRRSPAPKPGPRPPTSNQPPPTPSTVSMETKKSPPPPLNPKPVNISALRNSGGQSAVYSNEVTSLREEVQTLRTTCQDLQSEMQSLKTEVQTLKEIMGGAPIMSPKDGNHQLEELNVEQVQKLLQALGLSKHCQEFASEAIDGTILMMCDDQLLEHELNITSKLERIKLLQVISGKKSVQRLLQGSYVKFEFKGH